jgi:hypothetical protein
MKCRETKYWLYSFRPNASWPADVVCHLQACQACRHLQTQLKQIDAGIAKLTGTPGSSLGKDQLLDRIAQVPQDAGPAELTPASRSGWYRFAGYLTGAAAMIAVGWFVGRQFEPEPPEPIVSTRTVEVIREKPVEKLVEVFKDKNVPAASSPDRGLFAALLKRNAQLVQALQSADRLIALLDMADDCRKHALTLIADGPRDSLPMTIELYGQLLREGVLVQVARAPADERPALRKTVRTRLKKMPPADAMAKLPKVVEDQRIALQTATTETLDQLGNVDAPPKSSPKKLPRSDVIPPTTALVQFAIAYSSEADPVAKADFCADYVQRLMPTMMLCLAEDTSPERDDMGQQFGEMIRFGIYRPLEVVTAKAPPQAVMIEATRIAQNADQAVEVMESHLKQAPKTARPGLERAIEASKKGKAHEKKAGKTKDKR